MSLTGKSSQVSGAPIGNDGFWPDLEPGDLLEGYRLTADIPTAHIELALSLSMLRVNDLMAGSTALLQAAGHASAADYATAYPQPIGDTDGLLLRYQHAVFSRARAQLTRRLAPQGVGKQEHDSDALLDGEQYWLDQSTAAIADINGRLDPDASTSRNHGVYVSSL